MSVPLLSRLLTCLALVITGSAVAGAPTFTEARPDLYTGGQPNAAQLREFAAKGVKVVIDLRRADEDRGYNEAAMVNELGLHYISLPIGGADDLTPANAAALERALGEARGPVLLHCASGNRVGALLALAAAEQEGLAPQAALDLGKRAGLKSLEPAVRERLGLDPR